MARRSESRPLRTAAEVTEALDGYSGVEALTGATYKRCWDWVKDGHFPSSYYLVMTFELRKRGRRASPALWGMVTTPEIEKEVA